MRALMLASIVAYAMTADTFERRGEHGCAVACVAAMVAASVAAIVLAAMDGQL